MEKVLRNYKILFLIGAGISFALYHFNMYGKAEIGLLVTGLVTGYSLMNWVETKIAQNDARIDRIELKIQSQSDSLEYAAEVGKKMIRIEARIESLKELLRHE